MTSIFNQMKDLPPRWQKGVGLKTDGVLVCNEGVDVDVSLGFHFLTPFYRKFKIKIEWKSRSSMLRQCNPLSPQKMAVGLNKGKSQLILLSEQ